MRQIAYIDEFGNNSLDFENEGVSTHFIVTAIIIDHDKLTEIEKKIDEIRKRHFQTGEIKSLNVASNDTRRLKILSDFNDIDYHIFSIVIDKRKLKGEGFNYKESFYKFLHSLVDRELFRTFPNLLVVSDEHGGEKFKEGFIKYIHKKHVPDLFTQSEFKLTNSKSTLTVQLADFISGTLGRCFEEKKLSSRGSEFLALLKEKIIEIRRWPVDYRPYAYMPEKDFDSFDPAISTLGTTLASEFFKQNNKSKIPSEIDQCSCVQYLLFYFRNISPETYISTSELMNHIESMRSANVSLHYFRSKIIAKLRDKGVIVASSSKGYKLPMSVKDLYEFVNHSNSYVQPMIDRLINCRKQIMLATKNKIDIFNHSEFKYLHILKNELT